MTAQDCSRNLLQPPTVYGGGGAFKHLMNTLFTAAYHFV
jgi:hypothetical protein